MNGMQRRRTLRFFIPLIALAAVCSGQPSGRHLEIQLPPNVNSETFFARYVLTGQDFGSWIQPLTGVSSYTIDTAHATGIKAILYAPGCTIQTLSLDLSGSNAAQFQFICQPLGGIRIAGAVVHPGGLYAHGAKIQAKYVARWGQRFLALDEVVITDIPVGESAYLSPDGRFELAIPDLSQDPLAGSPDQPGEIQIWAKEKNGEALLAQLIPIEPQAVKARMGGLKVQGHYPLETVFAQCESNSTSISAHDKFGFAFRGDFTGRCDR